MESPGRELSSFGGCYTDQLVPETCKDRFNQRRASELREAGQRLRSELLRIPLQCVDQQTSNGATRCWILSSDESLDAGFVSDLPKLPNPRFPISPESKNARAGRAPPEKASRFSGAPSIVPEVGSVLCLPRFHP